MKTKPGCLRYKWYKGEIILPSFQLCVDSWTFVRVVFFFRWLLTNISTLQTSHQDCAVELELLMWS